MSSVLTKITSLLTSDAVFLLVVFAILFAFGMYFGRGKIISLIISFYPATILYRAFPFLNLLTIHGDTNLVLAKIGIFLVFLIPINIILSRYIFSESFYTGTSHIFRTGGFALVMVILIVLFSYTTVNFDALHNFSPAIDALFGTTAATFWWNLAPLVILAFL